MIHPVGKPFLFKATTWVRALNLKYKDEPEDTPYYYKRRLQANDWIKEQCGSVDHYIPSLLVIALPPRGDVYNFILDVEGYPGQFAALAISLGLIWLRTKRADLKRPFKAWLPAVWLRIALCVALIAAPFFPPKDGKADVGFFYGTYAIVGIGM